MKKQNYFICDLLRKDRRVYDIGHYITKATWPYNDEGEIGDNLHSEAYTISIGTWLYERFKWVQKLTN